MLERELIAKLRSRTRKESGSDVRVSIGDDCAVLSVRDGEELLVTTDLCIEGVHFLREWQGPGSIGHWCVTRGLSDIAAMGGRAVAVFLSFACPRDTSEDWIGCFFQGVTETAEKHGATLAGGDVAGFSAAVIADVTVVGAAPKGTAVLRSGARVGDGVYVSGALGAAAAELKRLQAGELERRAFEPQPQLQLGQRLRGVASAMIDISDGLSTDLAHLCEESGVSAEIDASAIPVARGATVEDALHGGDEYQLLFTAPEDVLSRDPRRGQKATRIGKIVRRRNALVYVREASGKRALTSKGWEHRL